MGLICALKEECRYMLGWGGWTGPSHAGRSSLFERRTGPLRLRLLVCGMGGKRAVSGLRDLLEGFQPDGVICLGFAGALEGSLRVGDLVWGKEVAKWEDGRGLSPWRRLAPAPEGLVAEQDGRFGLREGYLVSVETLTLKAALRSFVTPALEPTVMEMETYSLSMALEPLGIPLGALRAVSDEAGFDAGKAVKGWMDDTLRLRPWMLVEDLARHPHRIGLLLRLFRRSRVAARSLEMGLRAVLSALKGE